MNNLQSFEAKNESIIAVHFDEIIGFGYDADLEAAEREWKREQSFNANYDADIGMIKVSESDMDCDGVSYFFRTVECADYSDFIALEKMTYGSWFIVPFGTTEK